MYDICSDRSSFDSIPMLLENVILVLLTSKAD